MQTPDLDSFPELPVDEEGPVFKEPWEAQAFAIVVKLHAEGVFTWQEWAAALGDTIKNARAQGDPDLGNTYYQHWLATLEKITMAKDLATPELLAQRKEAAHQEHQRLHSGNDHPHGHDH